MRHDDHDLSLPAFYPRLKVSHLIIHHRLIDNVPNSSLHLSFQAFKPSFCILASRDDVPQSKVLILLGVKTLNRVVRLKLQTINPFENLVQKPLNVPRLPHLPQNLQNFLIRQEIKPRKRLSFGLQIRAQRFDDRLEFLVDHGQRIDDSVLPAEAVHVAVFCD